MHEIKEILINLLKIDSPSKKEKEIADYLSNKIEEFGYSIETQKVGEAYNIVVEGKKEFLVATHMDTIDRKRKIRIEGNKIYGNGASDAKASIASILLFLQKIDELNFSIAFFCDEEEDATGSALYLKNHEPKMAIIMEPTSLKLCGYHAGCIEAFFEVYSQETHGSFCDENAIQLTVEMFNELKKLDCWKEGEYFSSCITLQEIDSRNPHYLNPGICKGRLEARILPNQNSKEIAKKIEEIVKKYGRVEFKEIWNGFKINEKDEIVRICKEAMEKSGIKFSLGGMPSWTDAIRFNEKEIKCVVFGPGNLKLAHTKNEYIDVGEIKKASKFLFALNEIMK